MYISFSGVLKADWRVDRTQSSSDVLIYKIGDYANFSLENIYVPTSTSTPSSTQSADSSTVIIGTVIGSILGVLGIIGFFCFKKYKKSRRDTFRLSNGTFRKHAQIFEY
jgi:hypothetical protein